MPDEETEKADYENTKAALDKIVNGSLGQACVTMIPKQTIEPTFIRYTPTEQGDAFNSGAKQRVIRMVDVQKDPMEPPRFKTNKKIPRGPPSPPAPVLHSPPRKVTAQEQEDWKIPPCVSSWKNSKGYTIPLDMRLAADGRGLQDTHINDNFAKFSEAMLLAERENRIGINLRQQIQKKAAAKEKDRQEDQLRELAQKAREERSGIRPAATDAEGVAERDKIRAERSRDRERERRIAAAAPEKRDKLRRNEDRDVSEKIALGLPAGNVSANGGFDSRLFNQSEGMDSGFKGDDMYDVYDKAFRGDKASANIYRPSRSKEGGEYTDEDIQAMKDSSEKFHRADKGFAGTDGPRQHRDGPVQFEKATSKSADDVLGLDKFLAEARDGSKKRSGGSSDRDDKRVRR